MPPIDLAELRRLWEAAAFASDEWDDSARDIYNALPAMLDELEAAQLEMRRQGSVIADYKSEVERLTDVIFQGEGIDATGELGITRQNFRAWLKERSEELEDAREELRRLTQANGDLRTGRDRAVKEAQRQDGVAKGLRKERDALAADNARLREALKQIADEPENCGCRPICQCRNPESRAIELEVKKEIAAAALAATPAQSLAAHDAALLRSLAAMEGEQDGK